VKPGGRGRVYPGMTETLQDRLRAAADVYSEHPPIFCLFFEAADALDHAATERRAFLARAVCHPGPPLSETEDYDPETPLGELEAAILERMDHETEDRRDLWDIRTLCEEALGRTPDPARSTMQVIRDLCAYAEAARTYRANMEDPPADLEAHEQVARPLTPIVRPEHFAGPFPAISGYVKRTAEARAATVDQALRMLKDGQRLAVHDEPERVDILFLDPGQEPPLGQEWTVYGPMTPELRERAAGQAVAADRKAIGALGLEEALEAGRRAVEHMQHPSRLRAEDAVAAFLTPERRPRQEAAREEQDADLVMPLDIMVTVPADSVALPNIGGPAHASIMWSRLPIWSGLATLDLRFESELHDVTELGDRTTRYESESRGIGTIWLALDPKTAARVLEYVGRSVDYPVMLCVVWAGHPVQFGASLAQLADGVSAPEAQHIGAGREWHGYTIAVGKYPDLAARLFHKRNQASAESRED